LTAGARGIGGGAAVIASIDTGLAFCLALAEHNMAESLPLLLIPLPGRRHAIRASRARIRAVFI
jgi:hypothetical protein